jgi:hypothetical protein
MRDGSGFLGMLNWPLLSWIVVKGEVLHSALTSEFCVQVSTLRDLARRQLPKRGVVPGSGCQSGTSVELSDTEV